VRAAFDLGGRLRYEHAMEHRGGLARAARVLVAMRRSLRAASLAVLEARSPEARQHARERLARAEARMAALTDRFRAIAVAEARESVSAGTLDAHGA
jgi:hypothetical protein